MTNLGQDGFAEVTGTLQNATGEINRQVVLGVQNDASGNPVTAQEVYVIPQGTPNDDGTGRYVDPNTGGGSPGTAGADQTNYVVGAEGVSATQVAGVLASGTYTSDRGQEGQNGAIDGDTLGGATYSISYVIPEPTYDAGTIVPFVDPNTGAGSPGYSEDSFVQGALGGGNNATGKGSGLVDGDPASIDPVNFAGQRVYGTTADDFSDVGYLEEYAIPSKDYADANAAAQPDNVTSGSGGNAPGYQGNVVGQGAGIGLAIAEGTGYEEVYTIPYGVSENNFMNPYVDPNTGGNAPGYPGSYVTGAFDYGDTSDSNEGKTALEGYEIPYANDAEQGMSRGTSGSRPVGYIDPNNSTDQSVVVGSSIGDPALVGSPGWEEYVIPFSTIGEGDQAVTGGYIDLNTGGAAPGYVGDYVTGALGGGNAPGSGESNFGKGYSEEYVITSLTMVDPNTGGNVPGYSGDYVTIPGNSSQTSLVNLTEEFLGENTDAGKTTITEPSTTTKSTIVTSVATRCTANCD